MAVSARGGGLRERGRRGALLGIALLAASLAACGSGSPSPSASVTRFLHAWASRDWRAMRRLVDRPSSTFTATNAEALADLGVRRATYITGRVAQRGQSATVPVTERLDLAGFGPLTVHTTLHLRLREGRWLIEWTPETIDPHLTPGGHFAVTTTWPARAQIRGAGGVPLTTQARQVIVGVEGLRIKHPGSLAATLRAAGATASTVTTALAQAKANPTYFVPVFTVSWARYLELRPSIYPIPGTVFQVTYARQAITPGLAAHLVGRVGPITAQELSQLGAPYDASSIVGQTGLEQVAQSQLAGRPGYTITVVSSRDATLSTLAVVPSKPGRALETSIDPRIQRAAEAALAGVRKPAALVAVWASTGQILASVSDPASDAFDQALDGAFPPGSTFKTITSTALIDHGLSPHSPASCPPTITIDREVFHNAEGDAPVANLAKAFTESCNTAFIALATQNLDDASLPAAAARYGIGTTPGMGLPAFGGRVPTPTSPRQIAQTAIGQAGVVVSPLDMAMVAADIDVGTVHEPRLVDRAPDDSAPTHRLAPSLVNDLHQMMADVVADGTAAGQGLPPGTYAKTGTAEYGTGNPLPLDAWLIGFNGDIAFAVLVVNGGYGGPTCGPIAATFLRAVGTTG